MIGKCQHVHDWLQMLWSYLMVRLQSCGLLIVSQKNSMEMEKRANQDKPVRPLSACLYYQWLVILLIAFIVLTDIRNENNRNDNADDAG